MIITTTRLIYYNHTLTKVEAKLAHVTQRIGNEIPAIITVNDNGRWNDYSTPINQHRGLSWWTNGFYAGLLWQLYHDTNVSQYWKNARQIEQKLAQALQVFIHLHHDVGFQYLLTAATDYDLTQHSTSRTTALHAATLLAGRFNIAGNFIRAWNDNPKINNRGWAIIDSLMNVRLLYWASNVTGDPRFKQIAIAHTNTLQTYAIRADGSAKHIVVFDPESGAYQHSLKGQGMAHGSTWTRGQAWALYGFTSGYNQTGNPHYLFTAKKVADYFINHLRTNAMVPIDFQQLATNHDEDNSAAVIAASGLLSLAQVTQVSKYYQAALTILTRIIEQRLDLAYTHENLVTECAGSYAKEHHIALIYADYYFVEALLKILNRQITIW
ncbi:MAG: glycoside hydrolase family 88 protein [Liquorilactobacillus ghanensis]|uniref:glycoside hydrolase family 88 protein n=1 Tax=Liquorilactobacillus TaxID=2767888 RepID=UPI0039EC536F